MKSDKGQENPVPAGQSASDTERHMKLSMGAAGLRISRLQGLSFIPAGHSEECLIV